MLIILDENQNIYIINIIEKEEENLIEFEIARTIDLSVLVSAGLKLSEIKPVFSKAFQYLS